MEGNKISVGSQKSIDDMEQSSLFKEALTKEESKNTESHMKVQRQLFKEPSLESLASYKKILKRLTEFWQTSSPKREYFEDKIKTSISGVSRSKDIPVQDF